MPVESAPSESSQSFQAIAEPLNRTEINQLINSRGLAAVKGVFASFATVVYGGGEAALLLSNNSSVAAEIVLGVFTGLSAKIAIKGLVQCNGEELISS